jgi:hypothetical protein
MKSGHLRAAAALSEIFTSLRRDARRVDRSVDVYKVDATIPPAQAFRPLDQGGCPSIAKATRVKLGLCRVDARGLTLYRLR